MENKMDNPKILKLIISMSIPPALSMIIQSLYNIIDSMFITKFDPLAMEAISIVFPIQNIILAIAVGAGVGINAFVASRLGQKNNKEAESIAAHGILISFIHYLMVLLLGFIFVPYFIKSFTNNPIVIDYAKTYINLILIFSFTTIFELAFEKVLQADGKMVMPMIALLSGAVTNIILDPIFIFSLNMGVLGAAIATVIGQIVTLIIIIVFAFSKHNQVKFTFKNFKLNIHTLSTIYKIGIPSFFVNAIPSVMVSVMNYILVPISDTAVTTFGIYYKLQTFVYMGVCGISQGTMPIMGYHYGAQNNKKLKHVTKDSVLLSLGIGLVSTILFLVIPKILLSLFYDDSNLINSCQNYLRFAAIGFTFGCLNYILASYFQSIQRGIPSLLISVLRQLVILIPLSLLFSSSFSETGVYIALFLAEILTATFASIYYLKIRNTIT